MKTVVNLLALSLCLSAAVTAPAATNVLSDPVGFYKVTINEGANFVSSPLHKVHAYRGVLASATANSVTFNGNPNFTVNQFGPVALPQPRNQYILIVRNTTGNNAGDWWTIQSNTGNSVTVDPGADNLQTALAANSQLEIRKLTTFKDLFGSGADCIMNKSANNIANPADEDVVRFVQGTSFGSSVIYNSTTDQYRMGSPSGDWGDGSTLTIEPDEPVLFQRRAGTGGTTMLALGQVQSRPLTHYFAEGANTFGTAFPLNSDWGTSGLIAAGIIGSANTIANVADEDVIRPVIGTSFDTAIIYHSGGAPAAFKRSGALADPTFNLKTGAGYVYFRKAGSGPLVWRQSVPFNP